MKPRIRKKAKTRPLSLSTGICNLVYDANNRAKSFTSEDGQTLISCDYDYMGRRFMKKVSVEGNITVHQGYLYRGYLQIAAMDMTRPQRPFLWHTHWDPTEASATRPLSLRKNATWYSYGQDLTKNVTELYKADGTIASSYDYTPYGAVTATGIEQSLQWSSEVYDSELGMAYYNYRHYNPKDGRWINRDPIAEQGGWNLYGFVGNNASNNYDRLGLNLYAIDGTWSNKEDNYNTKIFYDMSLEPAKYYWEGPNCGATGLDASGIYRGVKKTVCRDYCKDKNISINLVGWSRGATIAMEVAEELEDDGCCCGKETKYPRINWLGLFDAVDMTITWGWANNITSNVNNASHIVKSENQILYPTSNAAAENPSSTSLITVQLENSNHGDVGATSEIALSWMVAQAINAGVKMKPMKKNWIVK